MKRQTLLLFALAIKPKLLLLDEAFDGLDPLVRMNLKRNLYDFIQDSDATIIISSHNLKELEDICDSYGILENGNIATYGDLLESKANINKYQLAFKEDIDESFFEQFDVLHKNREGSVYTLVIKGDKEEVVKKLKELDPLILDTLSVNFEELFISDDMGCQKPQPAYFDMVCEGMGISAADRKYALVIGDSLSSDMQGGINAGIDTCWYNPKGKPTDPRIPVTYQVQDYAGIRELLKIK